MLQHESKDSGTTLNCVFAPQDAENVDVIDDPEPEEKKNVYRRLTLEYPVCLKTYEGGPGRLDRLVHHIKRKHSAVEKTVLDEVQDKFRKRKSLNAKKK